MFMYFFFFFQAEDGIRDVAVTGVQTCALPICAGGRHHRGLRRQAGGRHRRSAPVADGGHDWGHHHRHGHSGGGEGGSRGSSGRLKTRRREEAYRQRRKEKTYTPYAVSLTSSSF